MDDGVDEWLNSVVTEYGAGHVDAAHGLCKLSNLKVRHFPILIQVVFVSHNHNVLDRELAVIIVLVNPLVQVVKAFLICDVKDEDAAVCTSIVACCQCAKPLLSRRVP